MAMTPLDEIIARRQRLKFREQMRKDLESSGFPMGKGTLDKLCSPMVNEGPPVAAYWQGRPLYDPETYVPWAASRCKPRSNRRWNNSVAA
jgi:hypothetical protein